MLPTSAGVEPATSWSPVGRRIQQENLDVIILYSIHTICKNFEFVSVHIQKYNSKNKCLVKVKVFATEKKLPFLQASLQLDLIYVPTKKKSSYLKQQGLWPAQDSGIRGDMYIIKKGRAL